MLADRVRINSKIELDEYTKALLHFNGSHGSKVFKDEIETNIWTPGANAEIRTNISKFGGASGYFSGDSTSLLRTPGSLIALSSYFTIDFWFYAPTDLYSKYICGQGDGTAVISSNVLDIGTDGESKLECSLFGNRSGSYAYEIIRGITTVTTNAWHHVAMVRSYNTLRLFLDGISQGWVGLSSLTANYLPAKDFVIGQFGNSTAMTYYNGYIDEFRLSIGIARWTADFTPPNREY